MMRNLRQARSSDRHDPVGLVHLPGLEAHDHETFCGYSWSGNDYEDTTDPVTCPGCLRAAEQARKLLRECVLP